MANKADNLSESSEVVYRDPKAEKIEKFGMIANFMWRRAFFILKDVIESGVKVRVLDPCAGGGKLLSKSDKGFVSVGYEPEYVNWYFAHNYLKQKGYDATMINDCFEAHFADVNPLGFHLVISIPYTDREINGAYEIDKKYLEISNYAFYVISRSIDVLFDKGIGIFCLPKEYVESEKYVSHMESIMEKADILTVEIYEKWAILVMKKN